MALSLSNFLLPLLVAVANAATVTYDWNIDWVMRNPDGLALRPVIGINGEWPLPMLNITKGDRVVVNMHNKMSNESTSVHFHGLFQNGTGEMDGPVGVTQCNIAPGRSMTYNFTIDQPGTYWYHSHTKGQYPDGLRGQFLIHDPENPFADQIDEEVALTVSDWYDKTVPVLIKSFISYTNPTGAEPIPSSALMNDTQNLTISVQPSKTYFFRLSNIGAFAGQYFWIEGHSMKIIEVDGTYTEPQETDMIYLGVAQRYGFLVTTHDDASQNFAIGSSMDTTLFDYIPSNLNWNVTGWLVYDDQAPKAPLADLGPEYDALDDTSLVPYDGLKLFEHVNNPIDLVLTMQDLGDGVNYAFFNDITYTTPDVPTLYTAMSTGLAANNATVYGDYTNAHILNKGDVVQIVINNHDSGKHPFHLHGHNFQVLARPVEGSGDWNPDDHAPFPVTPIRRDTLVIKPESHFVVRFVADNPGVWFFHCHIQWHLITGLAAVMVEAPLEMQTRLSIPENHYDNCRWDNAPYEGNAAGNTGSKVYDLTGQPTQHPWLPAGFTARGIVALVFSCVAAFVGMGVIAWYGAAPLSEGELNSAKGFIARQGISLE